jgi:phosphatidylserine/phosphatidylglycerophosphate/cardiolipin synthase-like enzyme
MTQFSPRILLACWELVKKHDIDVFEPGIAARLPQVRGWPALGLPDSGIETVQRVTLLDLLRVLALHDRTTGEDRPFAQLVATMPSTDTTILTTSEAVRALLEGARTSLLIIGYAIGDETIRRTLIRRGLAGIHITVVGDRGNGGARELLRSWPANARALHALENVESTTLIGARMHSKVIVADGSTVLVGSANFTVGGLRNNLEFGVRVGREVAETVTRTIARLEREGWLVQAVP